MERALVIGGTGMLADVAATFVTRGVDTTVVARRAARAPAGTRRVAVDYRDAGEFEHSMRAAGAFDLAVVWIHSVAPDAPLSLAGVLAAATAEMRFIHVLGSAAADPSRPNPGRRAAFETHRGLHYEEVILGFVLEGKRARWLTNAEIADGVLGAIDRPQARTIVGVVEPWAARP